MIFDENRGRKSRKTILLVFVQAPSCNWHKLFSKIYNRKNGLFIEKWHVAKKSAKNRFQYDKSTNEKIILPVGVCVKKLLLIYIKKIILLKMMSGYNFFFNWGIIFLMLVTDTYPHSE